MKQKDTVCIGTINNGQISSHLAVDLIHVARFRAERFYSYIQVENSSLVTRSRNLLIKNFLDNTDADWLLMIDADERLTLDSFDKLVEAAHTKDRPIVSALVFAAFFDNDHMLRPIPTIYNQIEGRGLVPIDAYPENEVITVDAVGTGCLLMHRSLLEKIRTEANVNQGKDWAWFMDGPINGQWFGEDLLFSKRLQSMGITIHAHTGAILAHHKDFWLDHRHHLPFREIALQEEKAETSK